jgi:hypothetical protein
LLLSHAHTLTASKAHAIAATAHIAMRVVPPMSVNTVMVLTTAQAASAASTGQMKIAGC